MAEDELERKRREAEEKTAEEGRAAAEAAAAKAKGDEPDPDADSDEDGEGQAEMFPMGTLEGDPKVTLKNLIKPNHRVEYTASLMSAEVPVRHGLMDPYADGQAVETHELAKIELVPIRETDSAGQKKIVGWKVRSKLRPVFVEPVAGADAAAA